VTWWHFRHQTDTSTTQQTIDSALSGCAIVSHMWKTGQAFAIMSCIVTFLALMIGVNQLAIGEHRVAAAAAGFVASAFILVTWGLGVGIYHETLCGSNFAQQGYHIGSSIGMYVAAWVAVVIVSTLNLLIV